jgi:hypothetical protein
MPADKPPLEGHEQLNLDNMSNMTTTKNGELFWRGQKIKVQNRLDLTVGEKIGGILLVIGTLAAPVASYFSGLESLCRFTANRAPFCEWGVPQNQTPTDKKGSASDATGVLPASGSAAPRGAPLSNGLGSRPTGAEVPAASSSVSAAASAAASDAASDGGVRTSGVDSRGSPKQSRVYYHHKKRSSHHGKPALTQRALLNCH